MRIRQYGQIRQLTGVFPVSVYLVDEQDSFTVVDTGLSICTSKVLRAAKILGKPIKHLAVTHAHSDHVGGVDTIVAKVPRVEFVCSGREARILAGDLSSGHLPDGDATGEGGEADQIAGKYQTVKARPTHTVEDGDRVGSLTVVATPGHTPGHVCYFHEQSGTLLAGDALHTRGGVYVAGDLSRTFPFVALATWDPALAVDSARRLLDLPIRRLATGHGNVLDEPIVAIRQAVDRAASKI